MVLGMGYCFLGAWDIIRVILLCTLNYKYIDNFIKSSLGFYDTSFIQSDYFDDFMIFMRVFVIVFLISVSLIGTGLRLFIGLSARSDARGRKCKKAYLVWLVIFILMDLSGILSQIIEANTDMQVDLYDLAGTVVMAVTLLVVSIDLLASSIYVRKYRKLEAEGKLTESENEDKE